MLATPLRFHNSLGREFCTVRYDKIRHVVVVVWRGLVTQESRAQVWQQLLPVLRTTGCPSLLNNWQEFLGAPSAEQQWLQQVWDEAATQAGLRFLADVMKVNSLSQDYLRPLYTPNQPRVAALETGLFYNLLDAYAWLRDKQAAQP